MEIKQFSNKIKHYVLKYKYAVIIFIIGLLLTMLPGQKKEQSEIIQSNNIVKNNKAIEIDSLTEILKSIEGAGEVKVLLSIASGEEIFYQTDHDVSNSDNNDSKKIETVLISDSQRSQNGLVRQVVSPTYRGAIIVCQGADNPSVKLAITQAVSKITGLGADNICVVKMK